MSERFDGRPFAITERGVRQPFNRGMFELGFVLFSFAFFFFQFEEHFWSNRSGASPYSRIVCQVIFEKEIVVQTKLFALSQTVWTAQWLGDYFEAHSHKCVVPSLVCVCVRVCVCVLWMIFERFSLFVDWSQRCIGCFVEGDKRTTTTGRERKSRWQLIYARFVCFDNNNIKLCIWAKYFSISGRWADFRSSDLSLMVLETSGNRNLVVGLFEAVAAIFHKSQLQLITEW